MPADGQKVISEKSDDCCLNYRVVDDECDVSVCKSTAPVCEYYEDVQFLPTDDLNCCGTYECACNPMKCSFDDDIKCAPDYIKSPVDKRACCVVSKCVSAYAGGIAGAGGSILAPGLLFSSVSSGNGGKPGVIGLSSQNDAASQAESSSSGLTSAGVTAGDNGDSKSILSFAMGNTAISAGAESKASSGAALASDYGTYASGRHSALAESYAKALASAKSGYMEGSCPGLVDASACGVCSNDQVCDGTSCVYPSDCPCYRDSIRRVVSICTQTTFYYLSVS